MEPSALIAIISVSLTGLGAFTTSLFHSLSLSRCSEINCFCFKCKREVLSEETYNNQSDKDREQLYHANHNEPLSPIPE